MTVELDNKFAFKTALRGEEHERLESCSRWPEKGDCCQECLAQINPSPENLERLLQKRYQGKNCAICDRPLTAADWRRSRLALLNKSRSSSSCVTCTLKRFRRLSIAWPHFAGTVTSKSMPGRLSRHEL